GGWFDWKDSDTYERRIASITVPFDVVADPDGEGGRLYRNETERLVAKAKARDTEMVVDTRKTLDQMVSARAAGASDSEAMLVMADSILRSAGAEGRSDVADVPGYDRPAVAKPTRTPSTVKHRDPDKEFASYTPAGRAGVLLIRELNDDVLLA